MFFPQFTDQKLTINGSWQDDDRQLRFTGNISSSAPFVILSLLKCSNAFHYMKHRKADDLEVTLNLYQGKFPNQNRYQHILSVGKAVNTGAISEGRLFIQDELPMTFHTGRLFTLATDAQNQPFICMVSIAKADTKSKRCGIWAVKPHLLHSLDEPWLNVFLRTRHGFIRIV